MSIKFKRNRIYKFKDNNISRKTSRTNPYLQGEVIDETNDVIVVKTNNYIETFLKSDIKNKIVVIL